MNPSVTYIGNGVFTIAVRMIVEGICKVVSHNVNVIHMHPPGSYKDDSFNNVIMPQIIEAIKQADITPSYKPVMGCAECEIDCHMRGMEV